MIDNHEIQDNISTNIIEDLKLQIREEELEIIKNKIKTGKVKIYKEYYQKEKTIKVPIDHEVLVIETKTFEKNPEYQKNEDIIRIPIMEEEVEIIKHPVLLNDVTIYKNNYQEIKHVEDVVKKELIHVQTEGNPNLTEINITN